MNERNTKFLARYYHDNSWYGVEIYATDWADAEAICRAHSLQLDGEFVMAIPAGSGNWLPNLIIRLRNALKFQ